MLEDPVVYEIFLTFNRDWELWYNDAIKAIANKYEVTEDNAKRLYKRAEEVYDKFIESWGLLDLKEILPWMKPSQKI